MKKLFRIVSLLLVSGYSFAGEIKSESCNVAKFHMINETIELEEIAKTLKSKGYEINLESSTAKINKGRTHYVDPLFLDKALTGLTIIVGATEQDKTQYMTQKADSLFDRFRRKVRDAADSIINYGHTKSIYIFGNIQETKTVYFKNIHSFNRIDDLAEEEEVSRKALKMIPNCVVGEKEL